MAATEPDISPRGLISPLRVSKSRVYKVINGLDSPLMIGYYDGLFPTFAIVPPGKGIDFPTGVESSEGRSLYVAGVGIYRVVLNDVAAKIVQETSREEEVIETYPLNGQNNLSIHVTWHTGSKNGKKTIRLYIPEIMGQNK